MESKKVLEKFLNVEFPSEFSEFTLKNKDFLVKYSILKENANTVLREIGEEITSETAYYEKYPLVKKAKELLQHRFKRFYNLYRGKKPEDCQIPPFNNSFIEFLEWWYTKADDKGMLHCYYCGIDEETSKIAFETLLTSEKFTGGLQIEKKDPNDGYKTDNCEFACVLCNNAKSDIITSEDFKEYFGAAVKAYWQHIKCALEECECS